MDDHVDTEDPDVEHDADAPADDGAGAAGANDPADDADGTDGEGAAAGSEPDPEPETGTGTGSDTESQSESLADRVAAVDADLGDEVADLRTRTEELESERDDLRDRVEDLESKLKRNQADFQNYKKRAQKKQDQIRERATEDLIERLVKVRDNLVRALDQDESADIRDGVESTLREFDHVLEDENVSTIEPEAGDEVDPHRHEVMMRVEGDTPEGTVADVYQPGYEMAEKVVRPAQITVSTGEGDGQAE